VRDPGSDLDTQTVWHVGCAGLSLKQTQACNQQRLRPERGAKPPSESERGWGPASSEKC